MTEKPTGPACGNNPNYPLTDGDRQAVADARAYLAARAGQHTDPPETDEQRADREETERDHARGDHTYCGITCESEMPTEHLRNFVIAKGYPGTAGALDELLRRARAEAAAPSAPADQAAVLRDFLWRLEQSSGDAAAEKLLDDNPELRRLADEAQQAEPRCTCADAGPEFTPIGHYADCPAAQHRADTEADRGAPEPS
ncbi:hypothetical protein [Streptomyces sp. NPDC052114]|uniref:hypothetical protein n=1 Tax=unclassified Streptomyces TaxID=2593676 RepID=UPI00341CAB35